jgi:putative glycosyltransferase
MKVSIVTTLYRSSRYVDEFYARCVKTVESLTQDFEIVFVNDGSPDASLSNAKKIADLDSRVSVVDLSRNFGHHRAILAGLGQSQGDYIFLIDVDLEDQPEWFNEFWGVLEEDREADAAVGIQLSRKGPIFERWSGALFYGLMHKLADINVPKNETVARLMSRRFVNSLLQFQEREVVFSGLCVLTGFKQTFVPVVKHHTGDTTYSFVKKMSLAVNFISSLSNKPLYFVFYIGVLVTSGAFALILHVLFQKLYYATPLMGWTSVIASIWLVGGLCIFSLGTIGIYVAKIFSEVKGRPLTLVREIYKGKT